MSGNESLFQLRTAAGLARDTVAKRLNKAMGEGDRDKNAAAQSISLRAVRNWEMGTSEPLLTPKQMKALYEMYGLDGLPALVRAVQVSKKEGREHLEKRKAS